MNSLLLLHGALGAKDQFDEIRPLLENNFDVHSFNFTGHGGENIPADTFSIEMFEGDIIRYMYDNGIEGTNVFGYSMGGYAALYAAKHFPEKFKKIFTLATMFEWSPEIAAKETKMLNPVAISAKVPQYAEQLKQRHGAGNWEKVLSKTSEMMTSMGRENSLKQDDYADISCEVTLAVGDRDKMVTLEETIAVYRRLKNAKLLVLPGTPHPLEQVDPQLLKSSIVRELS